MFMEKARCSRNCFQCPICFAATSVVSTSESTTSSLAPTGEAIQQPAGPYTLQCSYCHWSSSEVGLEFEKPQNLVAQLSKMKGSPADSISATKLKYSNTSTEEESYAKLKSHYSSQRIGAAGSGLGVGPGDDFGSSPGTLSRLMGLYTVIGKRGLGLGNRAPKEYGGKKIDVTEMPDLEEVDDESEIIQKLMNVGFDESMLAQNPL